jgi:hypothetical protein
VAAGPTPHVAQQAFSDVYWYGGPQLLGRFGKTGDGLDVHNRSLNPVIPPQPSFAVNAFDLMQGIVVTGQHDHLLIAGAAGP